MDAKIDEKFKGEEEEIRRPIFRDIRRYYCEYCGICRSKKALINSHILTHHKEELEKQGGKGNDCSGDEKSNTCKECGASFKKPAHLKQHMQSHSLLRPFICPVDDCNSSYRRKDHLNRHLLQHQGRVFKCPNANCNQEFLSQSNMKRHVKKFHSEDASPPISEERKQRVSKEVEYKNVSKYASQLRKHEDSQFNSEDAPPTNPNADCNCEFQFQSNMKRHVKEFQSEDAPPPNSEDRKQCVCKEVGCGKVFKYASQLRKHEDSHVKLQSVEAFCSEPGCMKTFTNEQCLRAHIQTCHLYTTCEICGKKQLKKNMKRHLCTHEANVSSERIKCHFEGCLRTFTTKSNLQKHVKAVHIRKKPFACSFLGCGMRFSYKHVRDKHEKVGFHVYSMGDFVELDAQFRMRPRGGRKRVCPTVEMLVRKRVTAPSQSSPVHGYDTGL